MTLPLPSTLTIDRTTILHGPCLLITGGQTIYSKGDVTVSPDPTFFDIATSARGKQTDQHLKDKVYKVSLTPDGEVTSGLLAVLMATGSIQVGKSVFGAGTPLYIVSLTDTINNYAVLQNASITKLPELSLASDKTLFGALEFTGLGQNSTAFNAAGRFIAVSTKVTTGTITGATNASPAVIASSALPANGDPISISGVVGNTAVNINGYAQSVSTGSGTFEISTDQAGNSLVAGNGSYTSGGTWTLGWPLNPANIITSGFAGQWATAIPTGTATASEASPAVFTLASNGLVNGDRITNTGYTNTALNGTFYVVSANTGAGTYELSATQGGAAINNTVGADSGTFTRTRPLDAFGTEEGMTVTFDLSLTAKRSDTLGTYDMLFSSLTVTVKGLPIGPTLIDIINASQTEGSSAQLGMSMAAVGQNLFLSGNGLYFLLYQSFVKINSANYSSEKLRVGDFSFVATQVAAGNKPLFQLSTSPITP